MKILSIKDPSAISQAIMSLTLGELVIYPTETCYGIAADCHNPQAVSRLLAYKGDRHRQVAVAVNSHTMAQKYVTLNEMAHNLYEQFLPGPITVISDSLHQLDLRLESERGTLGIRIPNYPFTQLLITTFARPITATSANTSGKKEPYSLADWQKYTTKDKQAMVSLFLDAGKLENRPTSTVVDTTLNDPAVLRQGALVIPDLSPSTTTNSSKDTQKLASTIIKQYLPLTRRFPLILALQGDLGVGKTQFVKGISSELGIDIIINSPTYTLMKEYPYATQGTVPKRNSRLQVEKGSPASEGTVPHGDFKYSGTLYHIDTWRLADPTELESTLHLKDLLQPGNIIAIEWAGKAQNILKGYEGDVPILVINIKELDVNTRQITYAFTTPEWS